jgi:hypothetical protein
MTGAARSSFRLDIVSDTICPCCYVGKRRLAAALPILEAEGLTFDVAWRPFQLNPTMPTEGLDRRAYRSAKFGSWEKSRALDAQVTEAGASAGLVFRHDLMAKTPNTVASHALICLARERAHPDLFYSRGGRGHDTGKATPQLGLVCRSGSGRTRPAADRPRRPPASRFAAARWCPTNDRAGACRSRPARGSPEARRTRGSNA